MYDTMPETRDERDSSRDASMKRTKKSVFIEPMSTPFVVFILELLLSV